MTTTPLPPITKHSEPMLKNWPWTEVELAWVAARDAQWQAYATAARADLEAENKRLREALRIAINQNEHDMLMTGEELRQARAVLKGQP